jgi:hypothetical protein
MGRWLPISINGGLLHSIFVEWAGELGRHAICVWFGTDAGRDGGIRGADVSLWAVLPTIGGRFVERNRYAERAHF